MLSFFPRDVLDEVLNLIELSYFLTRDGSVETIEVKTSLSHLCFYFQGSVIAARDKLACKEQ